MASPILQIREHGQSIWIDNLSRDMLQTGELSRLMESRDVRGITSNPAIFEKAIAGNAVYDADIETAIRSGQPIDTIYESLVFEDIRRACDQLRPIYDSTNGLDGYVSLEVPPNLANNTEGTVEAARRYAAAIDRPNLMIKIPGTPEGFPAIEQVIRDGISVNVTLLFSVQSYLDTAEAYMKGLEGRVADGNDISSIASVASFFLSRIDSKVDKLLEDRSVEVDEDATRDRLLGLRGKVAIANAKQAYREYQQLIASDRWQALVAKGASVQRLLWASTSTKNPDYSDVLYVNELIGPDTVNTLPPQTVEACADHCQVEDRLLVGMDEANQAIADLAALGIDLDQVMEELLAEGITKFVQPFNSLMQTLVLKMRELSPAQ